MTINLFQLDELAKQSGVEKELLKQWTEAGILPSEGLTADSEPVYGEGGLEAVRKITSLLELGYSLEETKKIIKKVGLPAETGKDKPKNKENFLTVGALADSIGISSRTIKHWEEKGIIEPDLRSQGGFRLYRDYYILFCNLIRDLQLFGYSLDEIKTVSDLFRSFIALRDGQKQFSAEETDDSIVTMEEEIEKLQKKMENLKAGIKRWEDLLKKQKKQIAAVKDKNKKRRSAE